MANNKIIEEARTWLGTPWQTNQALKGRDGGVDCIRLFVEIAKACQINVPTVPRQYYRSVRDNTIVDRLRESFPEIPKEEAREEDLLVLRCYGVPHHLAIRTDKGIIHASVKHGVVEVGFDRAFQDVWITTFRVCTWGTKNAIELH